MVGESLINRWNRPCSKADWSAPTLFKRDSYIRNDIPGIISFISYLLYSICFLATLFGMINTADDSSKELPLIGKIRILK